MIKEYEIKVLSESIIVCEFLVDLILTRELAEKLFHESNSLVSNRYGMIWLMNTSIKPEKGVMDYFASTERENRILCEAFCIDQHLLKFTANFYFKVKKPLIPSMVFNNMQTAKHWVDDHIENHQAL